MASNLGKSAAKAGGSDLRLRARPHEGSPDENWLNNAQTNPAQFINVYPEVLSREECRTAIDRFDNDPRLRPSRGQYSDNPVNRSGTALPIGQLDDWSDLVGTMTARIEDLLHHYARTYVAFQRVLLTEACVLTPLQMERIEPGQGFDWHFDGSLPEVESRVLAVLLYLADITEGGETQFAYQMAAIPPTAGSVTLFPPYWTHLHRGATPEAGRKYNVTSFVVLEP